MPNDAELTFVPLEAVWPRRVDVSRVRAKAETAAGYTRFQQGDVIVPKITPTFEGDRSTWVEHVPTTVATGTTELHVVRPGPDVDGRYLDHLFSSTPFLKGGEAEMIGVAGQKRVPDDWLRDFPVPNADLTEQRAIADYLDAETARIDALIAKKQQLIRLLEERWNAWLATTLDCGSPVQVRHVTSMRTSGPRGWSDRVGDTGSPFVRSANLTHNSIDMKLEELARVEPPGTPEALRSQIRAGDSLVGITGANTGWVAMADPNVDGGFVSQHVAILRPRQVDARWLTYSIASPRARDQLLGGQYGGTKTQLGLDELAELTIHVPSAQEQTQRVRLLDERYQSSRRCLESIRGQIDLLAEHRQALITAAVSGDFAVPRDGMATVRLRSGPASHQSRVCA